MMHFNDVANYFAAASSLTLRLFSYIFLRWIPGHHFPPIIIALLAIYIPTFIYKLSHSAPFNILSDEVHVISKPVEKSDAAEEIDPRYAEGSVPETPVEELDIEETLVIKKKDPQILQTLLTGSPSPSSLFWSMATLTFNLILVMMVLDLVYRPPLLHPSRDLSMARVGYVSDTTAKILVREPNQHRLPITLSYRYADPPNLPSGGLSRLDTGWKNGGNIGWLNDSTDFTGLFEVKGLRPDSRYQYAVGDHMGSFITAPRAGLVSNRLANAGAFTFLHTSCLKNNFPYNPFGHPLANQGLRYLAKTLTGFTAQFMLFLGDFIYIDVPMRAGASVEDYRRDYRQLYSSPDWPAASKDLPWIHVYDDHEIANDWDSNTTGLFPAANDPYQHYHISVNPPPHRAGQTYFSFTQGPATFFMLDTRRYRSPNDKTDGTDPKTGEATKTMLGPEQLADLLAWLKRAEPSGVRWKILVSSVPFTKNWWLNAQDSWRGYLGERQIILEAMWDVGLRGGIGVIVLSGDRHEFAATAFPPPPEGKQEIVGLGPIGVGANAFGLLGRDPKTSLQTSTKRWPLSATVHEFSCSPLSMFYLPLRTYAESSTQSDYTSDVCIKYIPDGNSKFGAVSISNPATSDQSVLHYRLFVDGVETWSYTLTTPPDVGGGGRAKDAIWG